MFWHGFANRRDLILERNRAEDYEQHEASPECFRSLYYLRFEAAVAADISNRVL